MDKNFIININRPKSSYTKQYLYSSKKGDNILYLKINIMTKNTTFNANNVATSLIKI